MAFLLAVVALAAVAAALAAAMLFLLWHIGRTVNEAERSEQERFNAYQSPGHFPNGTPLAMKPSSDRLDYNHTSADRRRSISAFPTSPSYMTPRLESHRPARPKSALRNTAGRSAVRHSVSFAGVDEPDRIRERQRLSLAPMVDLKPVEKIPLRSTKINQPNKGPGLARSFKPHVLSGLPRRRRDSNKSRRTMDMTFNQQVGYDNRHKPVSHLHGGFETTHSLDIGLGKRKTLEIAADESQPARSPLREKVSPSTVTARRVPLPDLGLRPREDSSLNKRRRVQPVGGAADTGFTRHSSCPRSINMSHQTEHRRSSLRQTLRAVESHGSRDRRLLQPATIGITPAATLPVSDTPAPAASGAPVANSLGRLTPGASAVPSSVTPTTISLGQSTPQMDAAAVAPTAAFGSVADAGGKVAAGPSGPGGRPPVGTGPVVNLANASASSALPTITIEGSEPEKNIASAVEGTPAILFGGAKVQTKDASVSGGLPAESFAGARAETKIASALEAVPQMSSAGAKEEAKIAPQFIFGGAKPETQVGSRISGAPAFSFGRSQAETEMTSGAGVSPTVSFGGSTGGAKIPSALSGLPPSILGGSGKTEGSRTGTTGRNRRRAQR